MDLGRLRLGEWVAAASGAVLLVVLFLPWFVARVDVEPSPPGYEPLASLSLCDPAPCGAVPASAFESFAAIDVLLVIAALGGLAVAVITAAYSAPGLPMATSSLATIGGIVATVLVLFRAAVPPDSGERLYGLWLGLAACAAIAVGGWLSMRDEGFGLRPSLDASATRPERAPALEPTPLPSVPRSGGGTREPGG